MSKSKKFKHVILTRYNWDNENGNFYAMENAKEWMDQRYELFKATRDSVLSQNVDFEWILSFDPETPKSYVTKVCKKNMTPVFYDIREHKYNYNEPWLITTRLDNDDILLRNALKAVQYAFEEKLMMIDMWYEQYSVETGKRYTNGNKNIGERYRSNRNSMFLSLVEPMEYGLGALSRPHNKLFDGYDRRQLQKYVRVGSEDRPLALMVVHEKNVTNNITGYEIGDS